jgi:hypothetical protein
MPLRPPPAGWVHRAVPFHIRTGAAPSGPVWLHEIKDDGFRVIARARTARSAPRIFKPRIESMENCDDRSHIGTLGAREHGHPSSVGGACRHRSRCL